MAASMFISPCEHPSQKAPAYQDDSHVSIPSKEHSNACYEWEPSATECGPESSHVILLNYD